MNLTGVIKAAMLIAPVVAVVGCASINGPRTFGLDTHAAALVRQTCTDIMGLSVSVEFEACGTSLAETVQHIEKAQLVARADQHCDAQTADTGMAERAKCVVMFRSDAASQAASVSSASMSTALAEISADTSLLPATLPAKRYYSMNQSEQQQRMELSCAQIGLHPSWGTFHSCVNNLRVAIADTDARNGRLP